MTEKNGSHWIKANVLMTAVIIGFGGWFGVRSITLGEEIATMRASMYTREDAQKLERVLTAKINGLEVAIARIGES